MEHHFIAHFLHIFTKNRGNNRQTIQKAKKRENLSKNFQNTLDNAIVKCYHNYNINYIRLFSYAKAYNNVFCDTMNFMPVGISEIIKL